MNKHLTGENETAIAKRRRLSPKMSKDKPKAEMEELREISSSASGWSEMTLEESAWPIDDQLRTALEMLREQ